jgi:hypothetical protein
MDKENRGNNIKLGGDIGGNKDLGVGSRDCTTQYNVLRGSTNTSMKVQRSKLACANRASSWMIRGSGLIRFVGTDLTAREAEEGAAYQ